jgi:hypothetical protein
MSKYIVAALTFVAAAAVGAVVLLAMLMAMNGYSESDSTYGIAVFVVLSFLLTLLLTYKAFTTTRRFVDQGKNVAFTGFLIVTAAFFVALIAKSIFALIGIGVAEFARVNL